MELKDFYFDLPPELIAQDPLPERSASRLLVVNRQDQTLIDTKFPDLLTYLRPGDVLVRNNTKVLPARLIGHKVPTGAVVELLLLSGEPADVWLCLVGNAKAVKLNTIISFGQGELRAQCLEILPDGQRRFKMLYQGIFLEILEHLGQMPLPPYIKKQLQDNDRYQTVYAQELGSAAAPTAGLHFTTELFEAIKAQGVQVVDVTLHVGLGTFQPLKTSDIQAHQMHGEYYQLSANSATILNEARANNQRIIAIGTTSARTLETVYRKFQSFQADAGITKLYLYPGQTIQAFAGLITNFHLPASSLILLVSTFATTALIKQAYAHAIQERYRFFSFGDAMLII